MNKRAGGAGDRLLTAEQVAERYRNHIPITRIRKAWGRRENGAIVGPPRVNTGTGSPLFRLSDVLQWEDRCHVRHNA